MFGANVIIKKGKILIYRVFDIAHEVSLSEAEKILAKDIKGRRVSLGRDPHKTIVIKEPPLTLDLGEEPVKIDSKPFKGHLSAKLWNYGALSVCMTLEIPENTPWKDLVSWACELDDSPELLKIADNTKNLIVSKIPTAIKKPNPDQSIIEDYSTFLIEGIEDKDENGQLVEIKDPQEVLKKVAVPELLLGEKEFTLAESTRKNLLKDYFQYSKQDLAVVEWNSALIVDFSKKEIYQDYIEILEFSLTHLLELRLYDLLLDEKLASLYDAIESKQNGIMSNWYSKLSEEAAQSFLEFSEFFEHIDNSLKTVGNSYLAMFFRETSRSIALRIGKLTLKRKWQPLPVLPNCYKQRLTLEKVT